MLVWESVHSLRQIYVAAKILQHPLSSVVIFPTSRILTGSGRLAAKSLFIMFN